jgi:hypothetical protein
MSQPDKMTPNPQPVSAITKHIKLYSDNPIHDCIDRIITACEEIDEGSQWAQSAAVELQDASSQLVVLAMKLQVKQHYEQLQKTNGNITN